MENALLAGGGNSGHAEGTTQAAVNEGSLIIRDKENQKQDVADLSRDAEHANGSISPIFDKEKEQQRLQEVQLIGEIGSQAADVANTYGETEGLKAAREELAKEGVTEPGADASDALKKAYQDALRGTDAYKTTTAKYGTGSDLQRGIQAATAALQGLAGSDLTAALAGASAPELANYIGHGSGLSDEAAVVAHAILGGAVAALQGNSAAAGAAGAATGELAAKAIAGMLYPDVKDLSKLSEEQKQTVSALATISAGMAGGLAGDSTGSTVAGGQAGKNSVENNALGDKDKKLPIIDIRPGWLKPGVLDGDGEPLGAGGGIAKGGNRAVSSLEGAKLKEYYRQAEKYGQAGVKELENGNYRFYGDMTPSRTTGEMAGARLVREWDPKTGQTRTWYETLDHAGNIRSVAPKPVTNDKNHHIFDADGNYQGRR